MFLSVLSALARLDLDPWREAASLSRMSTATATERLTSLLSATPGSRRGAPTPDTIKRLIGLLPKPARVEAISRGAFVAAKSKLPWPFASFLLLGFVALFAVQSCGLRLSPVPGGPEPAASRADPTRSP